MKFENLLTLIRMVSDSSLSGFEFEKNGEKIALWKNPCNPSTAFTIDDPPIQATSTIQTPASLTQSAGNLITSPLIGTFYAAPAEDAEDFVKMGDFVRKGQTLAIIEAMKLMNEIESETDGTVTGIFAASGETVEYGQALFRIESITKREQA